jgi:hypothetical protein
MALSLDGTTGISATGNIISSGGIISATGNIYGGNIIGTLVVSSATFSGNVSAGNLLTTGLVSATGNIQGNYILGNGSQLTGVDATQIVNGTSNAKVVSSGGNIAVGIGGTSNVAVFATTGAFVTGVTSASGNITGGNLLTAGLISATANVQGGNLRTAGLISATGAITGAAITGSSLTVSTGNIQGGNLILSGAITDSAQLDIQTSAGNANIVLTPNGTGNVNISSNIMPTSANATANIGSSTTFFNRLFAQATTALYADLAEVYRSDAPYPPGTVLVFGGTQEVTMSTVSHDNKIAGIVSTHPAHVMNSGLQSEFTVEVGLIGRVPCRVIGPIEAGDRVVSSNRAGVAERLDMSQYQPGVIIGKALESYSSTDIGTIEVVVGRL